LNRTCRGGLGGLVSRALNLDPFDPFDPFDAFEIHFFRKWVAPVPHRTRKSEKMRRFLAAMPPRAQARLIKPCTGILIYGPPGCGKTLLAKAVAKQSGAAFISVKASTLMGRRGGASPIGPAGSIGGGGGGGGGGDQGAAGGAGHSSVMVRAVFSLARKIEPCIVFFDEADGLCFKREEGDGAANR